MKIAIDMQGAQSPETRNRGIGRYTQSLVRSIIKQKRNSDEVFLFFSSAFVDSISEVLAEMKIKTSEAEIKIWHSNSNVNVINGSPGARHVGELSREAYILSFEPDVILLTNLFDGYHHDVVLSIDRLGQHVPTAVILYDLIPYLHRSVYLEDPQFAAWYERRIQDLQKADQLLAISEATRQDAIRHLDVPEDSIVNISSAVDGFSKRNLDETTAALLRAKFSIVGKFVLYTGGIDHRKNIEGLIEAYSVLPNNIRDEVQLVIVCSAQQVVRGRLHALAQRLGLPAHSLVLTGYVSESELVNLYSICDLFVFPSLYEGFGLPILEAMHCGAVVIASDSSSLPEVLDFAPALFDPSNKKAIADKIVEGLTDETFREAFRKHAINQVQKFSWEETGRLALAALNKMIAEPAAAASASRETGFHRNLRLAYLSPLPPTKSGIADYSAEILPELARLYDIDIVVQEGESIDFPWANQSSNVVSCEYFQNNSGEYDRILYHFGNSHYHSYIFDLSLQIPGVAVIHDFFLSGMHYHLHAHDHRKNWLPKQAYLSHGYAGLAQLNLSSTEEFTRNYPLNYPVLSSALGVLSHSEYSRELGRLYYGDSVPAVWELAPLARALPALPTREASRTQLGISEDQVLVCSFGIVAPTKLNHRILKAWDKVQTAAVRKTNLVFVGLAVGEYGATLSDEIKNSRANGTATITGWVSQETYRAYLAAADIAVQLRANSRGETSASVLDCLAAGLPTIVNANGSMAELPSDSVLMLPDEFSDDELVAALTELMQSAELRFELRRRGQQRILQHHSARRVAHRYQEIIEAAYASSINIDDKLLRCVQRYTTTLTKRDLLSFSQATARNFRPNGWQTQIIVCLPFKSDPEWRLNFAKALEKQFRGYRLEPVYTGPNGDVVYARSSTLDFMGLDASVLEDEIVDIYEHDIVFVDELKGPIEKLVRQTPGVAVRPLSEIFEFLAGIDQVELK